MSNTSKVTPYDSAESNALVEAGIEMAAACIGAVAVGTVALCRWLVEETSEDREAAAYLKEELRRERIQRAVTADLAVGRAEPLRLSSVGLHLRDPESLVRSAERLGYRLVEPRVPLIEQPQILLSRPSGERLAIEHTSRGKLVVHTAGDQSRVQTLVRQHSVDRATEHLKSSGMDVRVVTLPNGEVQMLASERRTDRRAGAAKVRTQVHADGTVWVDVDEIKGNRCQEVVADLAGAIGGQVSSMTKKDAYFQLPGEPTKVKVKV